MFSPFPTRNWTSVSLITWWSFFVTAAVSSGRSTPTSPTQRRYKSWQAQDPRASAKRWLTSCTSTAPTGSSSPSSLPRLCRSAWMPWPSTTTYGRLKEMRQRKMGNSSPNFKSPSIILIIQIIVSTPCLSPEQTALTATAKLTAKLTAMLGVETCPGEAALLDMWWARAEIREKVCVCMWSGEVVLCDKMTIDYLLNSLVPQWSGCDQFRFLLVQLCFLTTTTRACGSSSSVCNHVVDVFIY